MEKTFRESELIINSDGSVYHLKLRPEMIAGKVILVGDPDRVAVVSSRFDTIEYKVQNREFITHTGIKNGCRISVISSGIGTDNIDIVLTELDATVNIDLKTRKEKPEHTALDIVRIGTSGSLQGDIPVDTFVVSKYALALDGLMCYYAESEKVSVNELSESFIAHMGWTAGMPFPFIFQSSEKLFNLLQPGNSAGITATAPGFYGPQGRQLRLNASIPDINEKLGSFRAFGNRITNFEMETSAIYGLSGLLGHNSCTVCAIVANRVIGQYSKDHHEAVGKLIDLVLERLTTDC